MIIIEPGDDLRLMRGLDMGVNDYIVRPVDPNELLARVRTQVKRKRFTDHLRTRLEETVEMAILDPLSALHNRRYMTSAPEDAVRRVRRSAASQSRRSCSTSTTSRWSTTAMDTTRATRCSGSSRRASAATFGASTLPAGWATRSSWSSCLTPTSGRPCRRALAPMHCDGAVSWQREDRAIAVTASVGVAALEFPDDTPELILKRADQALYCAKRDGRNRVVADAA